VLRFLLLATLAMTTPVDPTTALRTWRAEPERMAWDLFGFTPDRWQLETMQAFADTSDPKNRHIAMQACAGPGKSAVEAVLGWNFLLCYSDGVNHPSGAVMSITADNLRDGLWKELAFWRGNSPLLKRGFELTNSRIFAREAPQTWFLSARTFPKTANSDEQGRTLSGLHSKWILYLIDESGDIMPSVLLAAEQGLGNCEWGKILTAGNPTSLLGLLYHAVAEQSHRWRVVRITGDPDDPNRSSRISREWAEQMIADYGRDNPWVQAYVLGVFPKGTLNTLVSPDEVRDAMQRHAQPDDYQFAQKRIGVDVARFGDDATVLFPRQGIVARNPVTMRGAKSHEIAARLILGKQKFASEVEFIDDTGGWAAGVIDACELGGVALVPINFSGHATDPRYFNKRSEIMFRAAEWVKTRGVLPNHPRLVREASAHRYWFDKGKLRVAEKDQVKVALNGQSPDYWDALCLTFAWEEMPGSLSPEQQELGQALASAGVGTGHTVTEFDPYRDA
jgi:phage terminase large subunit